MRLRLLLLFVLASGAQVLPSSATTFFHPDSFSPLNCDRATRANPTQP